MESFGRIQNGVVVFDEGANFAEGVRVCVFALPIATAQSQIECIAGQLPLVRALDDRPVARLIPVPAITPLLPRPRPPVTGVPVPGRYAGRLVVPDDFNEPLEELREYVE